MKKKLTRIALVLVVLLIAVLVGVAFFIGSIIKTGVETVGPKVAKVPITLDGASLSLLGGGGSIKGLFVGNPEGYKTESAIKVGKASLSVKPGSVFSDKIVIKSINVHAPEITLEGGLKDNNLTKIQKNIEEFTGAAAAKPEGEADTGAARKLQVDEFVISGARVTVALSMLGGKPMSVTLPDIRLTDLGTGPEGITVGDLIKRVMGQVTGDTLAAVGKAVTDLGKVGVDAATDAAKGATKGVTDGIKSINPFKKQD